MAMHRSMSLGCKEPTVHFGWLGDNIPGITNHRNRFPKWSGSLSGGLRKPPSPQPDRSVWCQSPAGSANLLRPDSGDRGLDRSRLADPAGVPHGAIGFGRVRLTETPLNREVPMRSGMAGLSFSGASVSDGGTPGASFPHTQIANTQKA